MLVDRRLLGESQHLDEEVVFPHSHPSRRPPRKPSLGQRAPLASRKGRDLRVTARRVARGSAVSQKAGALIGRKRLQLRFEHLSDCVARKRAHLGDGDRPAELARDRRERSVLEPAGGDPVRERCGVEVDIGGIAVRRDQRAMRTPIDAILRGGGCAANAREPSKRTPSRPSGASVRMSASSRSLRTFFTSLRAGAGRGSDSRRAVPARGKVDLPPRSVFDHVDLGAVGTCSSPSSVRRPSVTTGGCSRKITVSGIAPCETAPASDRLNVPGPPVRGRSRAPARTPPRLTQSAYRPDWRFRPELKHQGLTPNVRRV